jgi:hypothetical protein
VLPGGCTKGELTLLGQRQAIDTGAWLRQRYVDQLSFLPPTATAGAVSGQHTEPVTRSLLIAVPHAQCCPLQHAEVVVSPACRAHNQLQANCEHTRVPCGWAL